MQLFNKIASGLKTRVIHTVPGENDGTLEELRTAADQIWERLEASPAKTDARNPSPPSR